MTEKDLFEQVVRNVQGPSYQQKNKTNKNHKL